MHHCTYILAHGRTLPTHIYTHTLARTPSFAHTLTFANMYTRTHNECGISGRAGRAGISLQASIIEWEGALEASERASERRWRRGGGWKPFSVPAPHRPFGEESMRPSLATRQKSSPLCSALLIPSFLPPAVPRRYPGPCEYRATCTMWKRARRTARFTYQRIFILIPWIQFTSWIVQVETTGKTTEHQARYRPCGRSGRLLSIGTRDGRKIASYATRFHVNFNQNSYFPLAYHSKPVTAWFANSIDGIGRPYDSYLNGKRR